MIIDVHGHYTTAPPAHDANLAAALAALDRPDRASPPSAVISDSALRESVETGALRVMRERGIDVVLFSPKASGMQHHVGDAGFADQWARSSNDLVYRVSEMFPSSFAPVAQLPQTPDGNLPGVVSELRRCVEQLGFVGCNLNPDPSGGRWLSPRLTHAHWFPLFEVLEELDVPAMIHVSSSCVPALDTLGAHYLNADTGVFMQLLDGSLFERFPSLRLVIPHGGGSVPYHWGRYRGLAARAGYPDPAELLDHVYFDTCVYHQPGIDLLHRVVPMRNVLFGSEMLGAVRGGDPVTGVAWDDTLVYVGELGLSAGDYHAWVEGNVRRVYPRLDRRLSVLGGGGVSDRL